MPLTGDAFPGGVAHKPLLASDKIYVKLPVIFL